VRYLFGLFENPTLVGRPVSKVSQFDSTAIDLMSGRMGALLHPEGYLSSSALELPLLVASMAS
jgi:hypothetical protein